MASLAEAHGASEHTCIICAESSAGRSGGVAVYQCDHTMCAMCAARMRMLQKDVSCPLCKQESAVAVVDGCYQEGTPYSTCVRN